MKITYKLFKATINNDTTVDIMATNDNTHCFIAKYLN